MNSRPNLKHNIKIYGVDHSPWVQGVLLACAHHQIPTELVSYPLSFKYYWTNGLIFPAILLDDGSTYSDSFKIYELLEQKGYALGVSQFSSQERKSAQIELEKMFSIYALGRCMPGKRMRFIRAWSLMRERPQRYTGPVARAFLSMYFWILIQAGIYAVRKYYGTPYRLDLIEKYLQQWEQKLSRSLWLNGAEVGFLDFALWGHLQCMTSGLTDELIPLVKKQPHLSKWLKKISQLPLEVPDHYTQSILDVNFQPSVNRSRIGEQVIFWCTFFMLILIFPLTLTLITLSLYKRYNNSSRSGALISNSK